MIFVDDDFFDEVIDTLEGPVRVFAMTHIFGAHLVLEEVLLYPRDTPEPLRIGVGQALSIRRRLFQLAKEQGFAELTVFYHRVGPRRTGRTITHTRRLE